MKEMNSDHDYLGSKLPVPSLPTLDSSWLLTEIDRVVKARASEDTEMAVTEASYACPVTEPKESSVPNFKKAIEQAAINLETQQNK